jgi:hypothetical protein
LVQGFEQYLFAPVALIRRVQNTELPSINKMP